MKTIFETFQKSIYDPVFYKNIGQEQLSKIVRHYLKFAFILSLLMTVALCVFLVPQGVTFVKQRAPSLVMEYYPKDLSVHIEKGIATANVKMPYLVPLKNIGAATTTDSMKNMLVIDTNSDFDKKKFQDYHTFALLTSTDIVTVNNNGGITLQPLTAIPTVTIDQETLLGWVANIQNYLVYMIIGGLILTFLLLIVGYIMYLIPLLLFAFFPKLVAYIKGESISYATAYKMSLYAIIPALALKTLLNILGVFFLPEYFTLLVFMLIIAVNMREVKEPTLFEKNS